MSGLRAVEFLKSQVIENKDFRIDSNFYTIKLEKNLLLEYKKIGECLTHSQYGISIEMNEEEKGYPLYRMNEIHNMLCDLTVNKYADISNEEFKMFELNYGDVLFNRTNSYEFVGRTGVYYPSDRIIPVAFASYLVRLVTNSELINSEYLAAFLSCKYGVVEIKRRARQSINQTNVNLEEVKEIHIPIIKKEIQYTIKRYFINAHKLRIQADNIYKEAEKILLDELNLTDFTPNTYPISVKNLSESFLQTGRLDAEYYQTKYEDIDLKIKDYGYKKFNFFIKGYSTGLAYSSDDYNVNGEYALIRINNITNLKLDIANSVKLSKDIALQNKKDVVGKGDILISMSGTIGSSVVLHEDIKAVINQRILKISPINIDGDVLTLILNSVIGKLQFERIRTGGVQANISYSDIENMIIPILSMGIQKEISQKIQYSFDLRKQSENLLEKAKRAVEIAIEENEQQAMMFLQ